MSISKFASRMDYIKASEIRELLKITERPDIISFAGGLPAPELFPLKEISKASSKVILEYGQKALQYSTTEGHLPLRHKISNRMKKIFHTKVSADEILITNGSQQALDIIGKAFIDEDTDIFCESPSYLGALNAFRAYQPNFIQVETDEAGMLMDVLENYLTRTNKRKLIYVIPDFQNPTGRTWSLERREKLLFLANKFNAVIIEDNPYGELRFEGEILPSLKSMDTNDSVIFLGTFSKTFCPGMRIGWIAAAKEIFDKFVLVKQASDLHTSTVSQMQIDCFLEDSDFDSHINKLVSVYRSRRNVAIEALEKFISPSVKFTRPNGGLFLWLELPPKIDSRKLLEECLKLGVAFVPGGSFYACEPKHNTLRLNFSNMPEQKIQEGIKKLSKAIEEFESS